VLTRRRCKQRRHSSDWIEAALHEELCAKYTQLSIDKCLHASTWLGDLAEWTSLYHVNRHYSPKKESRAKKSASFGDADLVRAIVKLQFRLDLEEKSK
jgi:hypothetical protein